MTNKLQNTSNSNLTFSQDTHFTPTPRSEILDKINSSKELSRKYQSLSPKHRTQFLDICCGAKGIPLTYDAFFKKFIHPEEHPERLSSLLSEILGIPVTVRFVLQQEGTRINEKGSLVIMDIVASIEDGSLVNIEIQKIPYLFPAQRAVCYSADLIMRQYQRLRSESDVPLSCYKKLGNVYTIVLFEKSTSQFHNFPNIFLHHSHQIFDTGLQLNLLQEYVYIALDIFRDCRNMKVENKLDAWLHCLASDDPETIYLILQKYPEFAELYKELYCFRSDIGGVLNMYSEALAVLDHNTELYMIEEARKEMEVLNAQISKKEAQLSEKEAQLSEKDSLLSEKDSLLSEKDSLLSEKDNQLQQQNLEIEALKQRIAELEA